MIWVGDQLHLWAAPDHLHFKISAQSAENLIWWQSSVDNHSTIIWGQSSSDHLHLALIRQSAGTCGTTNSTLFLKLARLAQPLVQPRHEPRHELLVQPRHNLGSALALYTGNWEYSADHQRHQHDKSFQTSTNTTYFRRTTTDTRSSGTPPPGLYYIGKDGTGGGKVL